MHHLCVQNIGPTILKFWKTQIKMKIKDATHLINFHSVPTGTQLKDTDFLGKLSIILSYIQRRTYISIVQLLWTD